MMELKQLIDSSSSSMDVFGDAVETGVVKRNASYYFENAKLVVNIELLIGPSYVDISTENLRFCSKLIDGKYPDYDKVFPTGDPLPLDISKELLQSALSRASVLSNEKYRGVRFELSANKLKLTANNPEQESAEEELDVVYAGSELEVGFNIGYLLDVLNSIETDNVNFEFYGEDSSCIIKEKDSNDDIYVIMPMRL